MVRVLAGEVLGSFEVPVQWSTDHPSSGLEVEPGAGLPGTQARWPGATALVHDLTLATRNVKDIEGTGVALVNPFAG
jgi:hypothetical protein